MSGKHFCVSPSLPPLPSLVCRSAHVHSVTERSWGRHNCLGLDKATTQLQRNRGGRTAPGAVARSQSNSHHVDRAHGKTGSPGSTSPSLPYLTQPSQLAAALYFLHSTPAPLDPSLPEASQSPLQESGCCCKPKWPLRAPGENCTRQEGAAPSLAAAGH